MKGGTRQHLRFRIAHDRWPSSVRLFGSHGLFCYDLKGERIGDGDLGDMVTRFGWGEGASPVCTAIR